MVTALNQETEEQMVYRMYRKEKKNIFTIAMETGLTERHIKKLLEARNVTKRFIKEIPDSYFHQAMMKKKSTKTLRQEIGFTENTIRGHLRNLGYTDVYVKKAKRPSRETLFRKYVIENMTRKEIVEYYNTSNTTLNTWLEYHDIQKGPRVFSKVEKEKLYRRFLLLNEGRGKPTYEELYVFHVQREWPCIDLAAEYGVDFGMVRHWLKQYSLSGDMPHRFKDTFGISPDRYIPPVTRKEFAKMIGVGYTTIQKIFAEVRKDLKAKGEVLFDQGDYPKGEI